MDFKNVPKEYRPIPFWSWNEKLETDETKEQIHKMDEVGIGGFFMHARGGLQTEYMGEEWFDNVEASIEAADDCGMRAWAYDENGWPSGFGNGVVNGLGVEYQQKYLRMEDTFEHTETAICKCGDHYFYYDINPFYVDTLDKNVIAKFIEVAYEPYYKRFGNRFEGFFTDEPQISRNGIPWSFVYEEEYKARYNENILEHLEELLLPIGDYKMTRVKFWKMVTDLFSSAFMKQIYDWCEAHELKLTGHLVLEESMLSQLTCNGACMPHYEYFHIPGMDWLGRNIFNCLTPLQVSSVAEQLGFESVLSETFALCGHNISFDELKGMYEWQMVHGINLLCQHLEGYSIRGIRKRDYPPAMYQQQPWWSEYDKFNDAMSRVGMILSGGKKNVLLLHPQTTAWALFDNVENEGLNELNQNLLNVMKQLEEKHIRFHFGDETIMERHAEVKNGKIVIGQQSYSYVVDAGCEILLDNTKKLLDEFKASGGKIVTVDELSANNIIDNKNITYIKSEYDNFTAHYFVNTSASTETGKLSVDGKMLDIYTGDLKEFTGAHTFEPWGSLMIIEDGSKNVEADATPETEIKLDGSFKVSGAVHNCMTLDYCDYYFDGELQEKNGYVLNVCERANALGRAVKIHQDYHVKADYIPEALYLVCEVPEKFKISVNGTEIEKKVEGYFSDKSFKKIEISKYMKQGENIISFDINFKQSDEFYENLKKSYIFESEKNKLVYDIEIEAIYLLGDFAVKTDGEWTELDKNAVRYKGDFVIAKPESEVNLKHIEKQGYPFFSGELAVEGEIDITGEKPVLVLDRKGVNAVRVEINGITRVIVTDNKISLKEFGVQGKTNIKLTLINNLRNLLGPHHLAEGECYLVTPSSFFKEPCVWKNKNAWGGGASWNDDYCFVEMSI